MKNLKSPVKSLKEWHTSNSPKGMGDYYGAGIKNPVGKMDRDYLSSGISKNNVKKTKSSMA